MQRLRETMTDTLLSTYYYLDLEIIKSCFNFLTSCPMYLFVPHPPTPTTYTQMDFRPFGTVDLEQSEGRETPRGSTE